MSAPTRSRIGIDSTVGSLREALRDLPADAPIVVDPDDLPVMAVTEEWSKSGLYVLLERMTEI